MFHRDIKLASRKQQCNIGIDSGPNEKRECTIEISRGPVEDSSVT